MRNRMKKAKRITATSLRVFGSLAFVAAWVPTLSTTVLGVGADAVLMDFTIAFAVIAVAGGIAMIGGAIMLPNKDEQAHPITTLGFSKCALGGAALLVSLFAGNIIALITPAVLPGTLSGMFLTSTGICSEMALTGGTVCGADVLFLVGGGVILGLTLVAANLINSSHNF